MKEKTDVFGLKAKKRQSLKVLLSVKKISLTLSNTFHVGRRPPLAASNVHFKSNNCAAKSYTEWQEGFVNKTKTITYPLDVYQRSNQDTCLVHKPSVFYGQWVQKGDLLADCASSVGGELALGQNLLIAYMPWEGYNFEDAILISERLVSDDLYTSVHIEKYEIETRETKQGKEEITRDIPEISQAEIEHLDHNGIAKIGSWVEEGDILVGKITPIPKKNQSAYQKLLYSILEKDFLAVRDSSLRAPKGIRAKIVQIHLYKNSKLILSSGNSYANCNSNLHRSVAKQNLEPNLLSISKSGLGPSLAFVGPSIAFSYAKSFQGSLKAKSVKGSLKAKSLQGTKSTTSNKKQSFFLKTSFASQGFTPNIAMQSQTIQKRGKESKSFDANSNSNMHKSVAVEKEKLSFLCSENTILSNTFFNQRNLSVLGPCIAFSVAKSLQGSASTISNAKHSNALKPLHKQTSMEEDKIPTTKKQKNKKSLNKLSFVFLSFLEEAKLPQHLELCIFRKDTNFHIPAVLGVWGPNLAFQSVATQHFEKQAGLRSQALQKKNEIQVTFCNVSTQSFLQSKALHRNKKKKLSLSSSGLTVHLYLAEKRKVQVGDKLAGRHGNKGIISQILPREDMPYLPDGTPIDLVLNPLGVPSRMNVGQIYECLLGLAGKFLGENYKVFPFDEIYGPEASRSFVFSKLNEARKKTGFDWIFNPNTPGKIRLYDGRTGDCFDQAITVGQAYIIRLVHMVDDKIHCLTFDHEVLTTEGWVPIQDINLKHKVATLNKKGELVYQNPTKLHHYTNFKGELYQIQNKNLDLCVTLNHRMYVKKLFRGPCIAYSKAISLQGTNSNTSNKKRSFLLNNDSFLIPMQSFYANCNSNFHGSVANKKLSFLLEGLSKPTLRAEAQPAFLKSPTLEPCKLLAKRKAILIFAKQKFYAKSFRTLHKGPTIKNQSFAWNDYQLIMAKNLVGKSYKYFQNAKWQNKNYQFIMPSVISNSFYAKSLQGYKSKAKLCLSSVLGSCIAFVGPCIAFSYKKSLQGSSVAKSLQGSVMQHYTLQHLEKQGRAHKHLVLPAKPVDMEAWLTFFGLWVAEICNTTTNQTKVDTFSTTFFFNKKRSFLLDVLKSNKLNLSGRVSNLVALSLLSNNTNENAQKIKSSALTLGVAKKHLYAKQALLKTFGKNNRTLQALSYAQSYEGSYNKNSECQYSSFNTSNVMNLTHLNKQKKEETKKKTHVLSVLQKAIDNLGYSYEIFDNEVIINDNQLWSYLRPLSCDVTNKFLPSWVWELSQKQARMLLCAMMLGNSTTLSALGPCIAFSYAKSLQGSIKAKSFQGSLKAKSLHGSDKLTLGMQSKLCIGETVSNIMDCFYTPSLQLADEVMRLALHSGWSANKKQISLNTEFWLISIIKENNAVVNENSLHSSRNINFKVLRSNTYNKKRSFLLNRKLLSLAKQDFYANCYSNLHKNTFLKLSVSGPCIAFSYNGTLQALSYAQSYAGSYKSFQGSLKAKSLQDSAKQHLKKINQKKQTEKEEVFHYEGSVFCLSVPNEVFYVRRNGLPIWTGNSRSTGPYSLVTQQPLRGRSKQGGQRLGEMEVWALEGYGAAFILLEMLTIKSDDMTGRMTLWSNLILNQEISIGTPESFKVLICELQALCIDIGLFKSSKASFTPVSRNNEIKKENSLLDSTMLDSKKRLVSIENLMNLP